MKPRWDQHGVFLLAPRRTAKLYSFCCGGQMLRGIEVQIPLNMARHTFFLHVNHVTCAQRSETCLFMFVPCLSKWYPEKVAGGHACSECDRRMCWRRSQKVRKLLPSSRLCIGWLVEWTFVEHIPHEYSGDRDMSSSWLLFLNWAIYRLPEQRGIYMYLRHL